MENSKKIAYGILCTLFLVSCQKVVKNKDYIKIIDNNVYFKMQYSEKKTYQSGSFIQGDSIMFSKILHDNKDVPLDKIIDTESFDVLYNKTDSLKVNNDYYLRGDVYYFKDNKYVYVYGEDFNDINNIRKPIFSIGGNVNDYEVLGGSYLRVGKRVFCKGLELDGVDLKTFKTSKMIIQHSEWYSTIGFDKNAFYIENQKEKKENLKLYDWIVGIDLDSLQKAYSH